MRLRRTATAGTVVIEPSGDGVLISVKGHDGHGIGIANNLAAHALQDHGLGFDRVARPAVAP
jgi:GTP cyclohydrolase II